MGYSIRTIEPLVPLTEISKGETINDARRLIKAIAGWGEQHLSGDDKKTLCAATIALDKTLMRGWTEVDEALSRFSSAVWTLQRKSDAESVAHAIDCLHVGSGFLHRWQDRNGRIGNVE